MKKILLEDFAFKNVVITGTDGKIYRGYVSDYEFEDYNEDTGIEEDSIGLILHKGADEGLVLFQSEIADIRLDEQA